MTNKKVLEELSKQNIINECVGLSRKIDKHTEEYGIDLTEIVKEYFEDRIIIFNYPEDMKR
ncbi:MAG: hypothetical protein ACTSPI_17230 [Candidatus Heimdallarchaeaceae archaeon]